MSPSTLVELLTHRATTHADRTLSFLVDGESQVATLTFAEIDLRARRVAAVLKDQVDPGDRVLLLYPPGLDYVIGLFGALYAGAVVVPAYPPDPSRLARTLPRLVGILEDSGARAVLTTQVGASFTPVLAGLAPALGHVPWVATDALPEGTCEPVAVGADDPAVIQYTSGSTAEPKGVVLPHRAILANVGMMMARAGHTDADRILSWTPLYHDLGLFGGLIYPIALGAHGWLMSPIDFLKRPMRWMEAIHRFRATASSGPNFAFDLCVRKSTAEERAALDLSCWRMALVGAEPIRQETLDRFAEAFAASGFDRRSFFSGYGLAEGVLSVTGGYAPSARRLDRRALERGWVTEGDGASLVSCMPPLDGLRIAIVRDGRRVLADDVGEIWVSGPSVGLGYLNRPEATASTFRASLANEPGTWLRTGDLGFVRDGELYVAGRQKDLIIVRGRNVLPQDVERAAEAAHPRIRPGCSAAFSLDDDGQERLGVAVEVSPGPDDAAVVDAIRAAVVEAMEVTPAVITLLPPGALPKTSSGKVQRSATRAAYAAGGWGAAHVSPPPRPPAPSATEDLAGWLRATLADVLLVDDVAVDRPFAELGLDSLQQADIAGRLEAALGRSVSPALMYDHPTIERLVEALRPGAVATWPRLDGPRSQRPRIERPDPAQRVIVVGGGAAGLTTAWRLLEHGYEDIVVLERDEDVGGKVRTVMVDGRAAELGMLVFTRHYFGTMGLAEELGLTLAPHRRFLVARPSGGLEGVDHRRARAWLVRFAEAAGFDLDRPIRPGLCDHPADWWEPAGPWIERHGLAPVPDEIRVVWTTSGYGWIGEKPLIYLIKYLHRIQDWFGGGSFSLTEGNQELWRRLAARIVASGRVEVRTGTAVTRIERGDDEVVVYTSGGELRGAALVMACPPEAVLAVLDATPEERDLLGRFRTVPYVSSVVTVPGMRDRGHITWLDNLEPTAIGPAVMFVHLPDVGAGVSFQYTPDDEPGHDTLLDECLHTDLASVETEMGEVHTRVPWRFFPYLAPGSGDVPARVEALQGTRRTWFTGAWLDFEDLEDTFLYAVDLVDHLFAAPASDEVAIVGAAGRFAGAPDLEALWALIEAGRPAFGSPPPGRREGPAWATLGRHGSHGAFVDDVEGFDHAMFRMSPQEALAADPQHRLLLELAWSALEDAGIAPDSLQGTRAGVFFGLGPSEYLDGCPDDHPVGDSPYILPGNVSAMAPGRVAYLLGVEGPAVAVDSACSSALVALHQAAASLRAGECDLAIVGGAALSLSARRMRAAVNAGMLSPSGRVASFDADADGFVRGDGAGVVILQRLTDARDPLAVVRGSAVNQDGARNGLMAPNPRTREAVIRAALASAAMSPAELDVVEGHGSGTVLGDAMELTALSAVLAGRTEPCALTCVKPLLGHTEAASGMAGLLSTLQAMRHETIPGLSVDRANPHAVVDPSSLAIDADARPWPRGRRAAGVGAYSVSGTNAWVVLADPPPARENDAVAPPVLFLSAAHDEGLRALAARYRDALAAGAPIDALCRVAAGGRAHQRHRAALVADPETLLHDLARVAAGEPVLHGRVGVAGRVAPMGVRAEVTGGPEWLDAVRAEAERWPTLREAHDVDTAVSALVALLASIGVRGDPSAGVVLDLDTTDTEWAVVAADGFGLARLFARLYVAGARPPRAALRPGDRAPETPFHRAPSAWWRT